MADSLPKNKTDFVLDARLRVALLGASPDQRKSTRASCEELGLTDCTDFTFAHELLPILKVTTCHLLITTGEIGDMHWSTFFRLLRSEANIPFVPAVFIPAHGDSTVKNHTELLHALHIEILPPFGGIQAGGFDPASFQNAIKKVVHDDRNAGTYAANLAQAKDFYRTGLKSQAQKIYRSLLKDKPDDLLATLGAVQSAPFADKQIHEQLLHLIDSDPSNYCFWFELLNYFAANKSYGRFAEAFEALSAELRSASDSYWLFHLATICLSLHQPKYAARCLSLLEKGLSPQNDWMPYYLRARICLTENNLDMAEKELGAALANCKVQSAELHNIAGVIARRRHLPAAAVEAFSKAAHFTPLDYRIQYNLALAYLEDHQKGRAIHALYRAVEIFPDYDKAASKLREVSR